MNYTKLKQEIETEEQQDEIQQQNIQYQESLQEIGIGVLNG